MKTISEIALMSTLFATNALASSVCLVSTGSAIGVKTTVTCDGKQTSSFSTDENFDGALSLNFKKLIEKGYKLQAATAGGQDVFYSYVFIKE
jgi:hypothetical protein